MIRWLSAQSMYRVMLWYLLILSYGALVISFRGGLPFSPLSIFFSGLAFSLSCFLFNALFAWIVKVKTNPESPIISGLILALIMTPLASLERWWTIPVIAAAAMASKYVLTFRQRHFLNPAALAAVLAALLLGEGASWWVGSLPFPLLVIGGLLILWKIRRFDVALVFLVVYVAGFVLSQGGSMAFQDILQGIPFSLFFFASVMLIEPLTSPTLRAPRLAYAALVACFLILLQRFLPQIGYSLELALIIGNVVALFVRSHDRYLFTLREKKELISGIWQFSFRPIQPIHFQAGQYLEWMIPHSHPDARGVRRYFTIASSPTEDDVTIVTKIPSSEVSSFKNALKHVAEGATARATQVAGDFVLPKDPSIPLVFIAGGIGITPFHSMIQYLLAQKEKRTVTLFYAAKTPKEFVFTSLFEEAQKTLGLKVFYVASETPASWQGVRGIVDESLIKKEVPDYMHRCFYLSGPEPMVGAFTKMLRGMGIASRRIKRDFFPGYTETYRDK